MPNIAVLNYCNISCPYCFANSFIKDENKQLITLEQLDNIFSFLKKSIPINRQIGLIGGEPTLHPQLKEILIKTIKFSQENQLLKPILFTNGIEFENYIPFANDIAILFNINNLDILGEKNYNKLIFNLKLLNNFINLNNQNFIFGINLYPNIKDCSYIFDLAKQFNQSKIRCSIAAPTCQFVDINREDYYNLMKPIFLKFLKMAKLNNIQINMDCNKIPLCYFNAKEYDNIMKYTVNYHTYCQPVIDITPTMQASSCFGAYQLVNLNDFNNLYEVERFFNFNIIYQKTLQNYTGKCKTCNNAKNFSCQGGCLAFVNK